MEGLILRRQEEEEEVRPGLHESPRCPERMAKSSLSLRLPGAVCCYHETPLLAAARTPSPHLGLPPPESPPRPIFSPFSAPAQGLSFPDMVSYLIVGMVQGLPMFSSLFSTQRGGRWRAPEKAAGEAGSRSTAAGRCAQAHPSAQGLGWTSVQTQRNQGWLLTVGVGGLLRLSQLSHQSPSS